MKTNSNNNSNYFQKSGTNSQLPLVTQENLPSNNNILYPNKNNNNTNSSEF